MKKFPYEVPLTALLLLSLAAYLSENFLLFALGTLGMGAAMLIWSWLEDRELTERVLFSGLETLAGLVLLVLALLLK